MRIGYLECFSGISGDMLLGAMVDAGVSFDCLDRTTDALNVGARLQMRKVSRGGLAATKVDVITPEQTANEDAHVHEAHSDHTHEPQSGVSGVSHVHPAHEHEPHTHAA